MASKGSYKGRLSVKIDEIQIYSCLFSGKKQRKQLIKDIETFMENRCSYSITIITYKYYKHVKGLIYGKERLHRWKD